MDDDDGIIGVISRQVRQRRESIYEFRKGNREDLVEREEAELAILLNYLPPQLTGEELAGLAQAVIGEVGARGPGDKGKVMGKLMPQVRGKAEGSGGQRGGDRTPGDSMKIATLSPTGHMEGKRLAV